MPVVWIDLSGAHLEYAKLTGTKLAYAVLSGADLENADLTGASVAYADLAEAWLENADKVCLSSVSGFACHALRC
jgi:uncharacterized protein YjbI with pentapeptide repeats